MPRIVNPLRDVIVPGVTVIGDGPDRRTDRSPSPFLIDPRPHRVGDERASTSWADQLVELTDELFIETDVHTHRHIR